MRSVGSMIRGGWRPDQIVYHGLCEDGFGAALAVHIYFSSLGKPIPEEKYFGITNRKELPETENIPNEKWLFLDYVPPRETLCEFLSRPNNPEVMIIDHHKSGKEIIAGLPASSYPSQIEPSREDDGLDSGLLTMSYDETKSASCLTWSELFPKNELPKLFKFINDRDLWKWHYEETEAITLALDHKEFRFGEWIKYLEDSALHSLRDMGNNLMIMKTRQIDSALKNQHTVKVRTNIGTWHVPAANAQDHWSHVGEKLLEQNPEAPFAVVWGFGPHGVKVSLRSKRDNVDVSRIAQEFNGGGHAKAAGCSIKDWPGWTILPDGSAEMVAQNVS